jgi:hypothetical protein
MFMEAKHAVKWTTPINVESCTATISRSTELQLDGRVGGTGLCRSLHTGRLDSLVSLSSRLTLVNLLACGQTN